MSFLRKKDETCATLASLQARVFQRSADEGISSRSFVRAFMTDPLTQTLDSLDYLLSGLSSDDLFFAAAKRVPSDTRGNVLPGYILHWVGYIYRTACYLTGLTSKSIYRSVPLDYLTSVYPLYHGLDPVKAVQMILGDNNVDPMTPMERFEKLYRHKAG